MSTPSQRSTRRRSSSTRSSRSIPRRPAATARSTSSPTTRADCSSCAVKSNVKSRPGVMTVRGCAYAGSKGVVWGPVKDMIHISHGPVGCGAYSNWSRRNYYNGETGVDAFGTMHFTSDFQERDIVYGGDKKLGTIVDELDGAVPARQGHQRPVRVPGRAYRRRHRAASPRPRPPSIGKPVVPVRCEGFRGVSQSLGPPHRQRRDPRPRLREGRDRDRDHALRRHDHRRLQHRRRRVGVSAHPRGDGAARHRAVDRRRDAGRARQRAQGQAQPHPLLPLDELHLPAHGRDVRHPVGGVQLLRPDQDLRARSARSPRTSTTRSRPTPRRSSRR